MKLQEKEQKRKYRLLSRCLNTMKRKSKIDELNEQTKLHYIFVIDGRIFLVKPEVSKLTNEQEPNYSTNSQLGN
jgi:hypothetical protein